MDLGVIITAIIGVLSNIITGWTSWFITRKKYNSEVDNNLIQNMQESLEFYKKLSDDNRARLEEFIKQNDELEKKDNMIEEKNKALEEEVKLLNNRVYDLMQNICLNLTCKNRKKVSNETDSKKSI